MQRSAVVNLFEIRKACADIRESLADKSPEDLSQSELLRSATEYSLLKLGRNLSGLNRYFPEIARKIPKHQSFIRLSEQLLDEYWKDHLSEVWELASVACTLVGTLDELITKHENEVYG